MFYEGACKPENPMIPQKLHPSVDIHTSQGNSYETEEHLEHGENRRFVEDFLASSFVDELQHLMSSDVTIRRTDAPLELLKIYFLFNFTHDGHVRFGYCQVRSSFEAEFLVNGHDIVAESHLHKESWVFIGINCSHIFIEINHVLVIREQFAK